MANWIKVVLEVVLSFITLAVGSSFWSLVRLPKYLLAVMRTPGNLDLLQISQFTGVIEVDPNLEARIGYPSLLFTDVKSSLSAWRLTKFGALIGSLMLIALSFLLGLRYLVVTVLIFFYPD